MNTQSQNTLKILQLLLRCGMVCREELNVVCEMMLAIPDSRAVALQERGSATAQRRNAAAPGGARVTNPTEHLDPGL